MFYRKEEAFMIRMAVFDTKPYDRLSLERREHEGIAWEFFETKLDASTVSLAQGFDGVVAFVNDDLCREVIDALHAYGVRLIALRCAGYNQVDVRAAFGKIHIVRVPAYSPEAIAEHTMALLLTSIRRIHKAYNRTREFNFSIVGLCGFELNGKTVGVIGAGKIGRAFIRICQGFGMQVLAYDKHPSPIEGVTFVSLEELYARSDVISLHCPMTEENYHMIDRGAMARMKEGVVLLNTSRGGLIDAEDLIEGIKEKRIGAACLDVYEEESDIFFEDKSGHILRDDVLARLLSMPNVLITSHQAFLTEEALDSIAETTVENIRSFFRDGVCENEVCYHCERLDDCRKARRTACF